MKGEGLDCGDFSEVIDELEGVSQAITLTLERVKERRKVS